MQTVLRLINNYRKRNKSNAKIFENERVHVIFINIKSNFNNFGGY